MVRPDDDLVWLRLHISGVRGGDGKLRYTVSHVEDITVRHRQELELRASEQRYRTVVESSPASSPASTATAASPTSAPRSSSLTGMPVERRDRPHGQHLRRGRRGAVEQRARPRVQRAASGSTPSGRCRMPDGGVMWFQSRAVPEFGEDGTVEHVLVMNTDITALKRPRPSWPTRRCTTRSPAWPTGRCCSTSWRASWPAASGRPHASGCCSSTSTGSRWSTTRSATPPATSCSSRSADAAERRAAPDRHGGPPRRRRVRRAHRGLRRPARPDRAGPAHPRRCSRSRSSSTATRCSPP